MTPAPLDLIIYQGTTFQIVFSCRDAGNTTIDLTGWTPQAQARQGSTLKIDLAPTVTNAALGEVTIALSDEQTQVLELGRFRWDLVLENSTGERLGPFLAGECVVARINTQP